MRISNSVKICLSVEHICGSVGLHLHHIENSRILQKTGIHLNDVRIKRGAAKV